MVEPADLVPLLFAHSAYKSYSESWLTEGRWDRMAKWLRTVSTPSLDGLDLDGVTDLNEFVTRLGTVECYVTCSSGTTGKPAMIPCSATDLDIASQTNVRGLSWATGIAPDGRPEVPRPRPADGHRAQRADPVGHDRRVLVT